MMLDPTSIVPSKLSKTEEWINFHKALGRFGPKVANSEWVKFWVDRGSSSANTLDLRNYLKSHGITISESTFDSVVDKGAGALGFFGDIFKVGKWVGIGLTVAIAGGIVMIIYNVAKNPIAAASAAASLKTGGPAK